MDIAAVSMMMSASQLSTNVGTALLSKNLDTAEVLGDGLIQMMEQSVNPTIGQNIDIKL
ncbi:hypothetical protein acsn021_42040 [Anaerocolumna cellulosilytica]|uniref:Uncharacterized protein n=1 Tax=Anaerocolumna cellulosilytica TaxID=433286 RepID=A0A6S6RCB2_9FIRM|nr:YjfB family protein [Anaerocolumna cellulosilytica]MBB5195163.1 hypothetical protein [Anaerocolumna cellulosilytica]BCJ96635.1 hypothetical protein acsn021_42040 [Anaerocolumna cellulosilytica]